MDVLHPLDAWGVACRALGHSFVLQRSTIRSLTKEVPEERLPAIYLTTLAQTVDYDDLSVWQRNHFPRQEGGAFLIDWTKSKNTWLVLSVAPMPLRFRALREFGHPLLAQEPLHVALSWLTANPLEPTEDMPREHRRQTIAWLMAGELNQTETAAIAPWPQDQVLHAWHEVQRQGRCREVNAPPKSIQRLYQRAFLATQN